MAGNGRPRFGLPPRRASFNGGRIAPDEYLAEIYGEW
jgi:hypothetical protein